jgi:hypothetical protein
MKLYDRTSAITLFFGIAFVIFGLLAGGCAHVQNIGMIYTEQGLEAADRAWDEAYHKRLEYCQERYAPATPEAEECFGPYYAADLIVSEAVEEAVLALRDYWRLRAAGYEPTYKNVAARVESILRRIPKLAAGYFLRVKGLR